MSPCAADLTTLGAVDHQAAKPCSELDASDSSGLAVSVVGIAGILGGRPA